MLPRWWLDWPQFWSRHQVVSRKALLTMRCPRTARYCCRPSVPCRPKRSDHAVTTKFLPKSRRSTPQRSYHWGFLWHVRLSAYGQLDPWRLFPYLKWVSCGEGPFFRLRRSCRVLPLWTVWVVRLRWWSSSLSPFPSLIGPASPRACSPSSAADHWRRYWRVWWEGHRR